MSEQVVEQKETQPASEPAEQKPKGTEFVDFSELPEEVREKVESRFRRIYGNLKETERREQQILKDQEALLARLEKIESTQVQDKAEQRFESLNAQKKAALAAGDLEKFEEIDNRLMEEMKEFAKPKEAPKSSPKVEAGTLTPEAEEAIRHWANETDEEGQFVRPWAQLTHPMNAKVLPIAQGVLDDPEYRGARAPEILAEIDRRVAQVVLPKKRTQTVLGGDGSVTPKNDSRVRLSEDQKYIARRMYPKLSSEEAEKRYAKALKG